jgi:signal transduction histidine kinase/CheY-like chemotaxis protein
MDEMRMPQALFDEVRQRLLTWALVPPVVVATVLALIDLQSAPLVPFTLSMILFTLCGLVARLRHLCYPVAAWVLCLGSLGIALLTCEWIPFSDAHHAVLYPVLVAGITIGPWAALVASALASLGLAYGMGFPTYLPPAYATNLLLVWSIGFLAYIAQRPEKRVIEWAWHGYRQARDNLDMARDRQLQLKQALQDLALANAQTTRLNEMLSAARRAVEEARRAKEEFVANVSHELRTPLNMIIGFSDMILGAPGTYAQRLPPALLADVAAIKRNSQHLASLVDDVLDLAEVETGRMQLFREPTSIKEVIQEAMEAVSVLFEQKGLSLTLDVPDDLPPAYCDRTRIRQVILNLLSNAGRFTEEGGAIIRARCEQEILLVSVADTGPGLDPDSRMRLFQPFQQADASIRRRYGGTGLGLAISQRFVEMHGGRIWLEGAPKEGTMACFTLPAHKPTPEDGTLRWFSPYQEYAPRNKPSQAPLPAVKPRVVVVERGQVLTELIARYVEDLEAVPVPSLEEAGAAIDTLAPVAMVINEADIDTPEGGALRLPEMSFDIPITRCWISSPQPSVLQEGVQEYLIKPIVRGTLIETLDRVAPEGRTVLVVDDDPEALQLFGRMLASTRRRYAVLDAEDGATALELLRERRPDVLLLDLVMPNGDGFSVLRAKAQDDAIRNIPVIIISATDPQREPIISRELIVTRQQGLSAREVVLSLRAITHALQPRYGAPARHGTPAA